MSFEFTKIKIEKIDSVGKIILNSPETLNIIEKETFEEINEALNHFETQNETKIILISAICGVSRAGGKIFSAGVNLKKYNEKLDMVNTSPDYFKEHLKSSRALIRRIEQFNKPVVIAVDGFVTGGFFELALACDVVLTSRSAVFSLNEVNVGLIPGYGGIHRLLRLIGKNRAFEIIATSRKINAEEAFSLGISLQIFDEDNFDIETNKFCQQLALKPQSSINLVKETIYGILSGKNVEQIEIENFIKAISSEDAEKQIKLFCNFAHTK
ncbi:MAG TPA: enoyl-CoA hydratase/isomerase family protein [Candidatus Gastranaerophilales bacterium]|nr:enoyl-CoA hydratase/isomerase family protein [Candidatus Gastranaerophilales bacterium]